MRNSDGILHSVPGAGGAGREPEDPCPVGMLVLGRYRVLNRLGAGGMGVVYEVEHVALGSRFAVKVLLPVLARDRATVRRFAREARAMALLQSEHVTRILDLGELPDGTPLFVMERLYGEDLQGVLRRSRPLPVRRAVGIMLDACLGVRAMHKAGLVHRDLKPANLHVSTRETGEELCKILDFGVVKSVTSTTTREGRLVGTLRYMAPEQLEHATVDQRTDVYALGAVLYECLAGQPPHSGDTLERLLYAIMNGEPAPLERVRSDLPRGLSAEVGRALARDANRRFATVAEFAAALAPYAGKGRWRDPSAAPTFAASLAATSRRSARGKGRGKWKHVRLIASGLVGIGFGWGLATGWSREQPVPPAASAGPLSVAEAAAAPTSAAMANTPVRTAAAVEATSVAAHAPTGEAARRARALRASKAKRNPKTSPPPAPATVEPETQDASVPKGSSLSQVPLDGENPYAR